MREPGERGTPSPAPPETLSFPALHDGACRVNRPKLYWIPDRGEMWSVRGLLPAESSLAGKRGR